MQKKTKSKLLDSVVVIFCLAGTSMFINLFWQDLNKTLTKLNELPIATISWKYKSSQRKFLEKLVWDRLQQDAPLYNGDTVRTSDQASATITFTDNNVIELGSNSIIQIFMTKNNESSIDFNGGNVYVDTQNSNQGIVIRSGTKTLNLDNKSSVQVNKVNKANRRKNKINGVTCYKDGTRVSMTLEEYEKLSEVQIEQMKLEGYVFEESYDETEEIQEDLNLQVVNGNASVQDAASGNTTKLSTGEAINIKEDGSVKRIPITILEPASQAKYLNLDATRNKNSSMDVTFTWSYSKENENDKVILETADDMKFTRNVKAYTFTDKNTKDVPFTDGQHYWRIYIMQNGKMLEETETVGKLKVFNAPKPEPLVPESKDTFNYRKKFPSIRFIWDGNEYASSYKFEIADNKDFENPIISQTTSRTSSIISSLEKGHYYWRVLPFYTFNMIGYTDASDIHEFEIHQQGELKAPTLVLPAQNGFINTLEQSKKSNTNTFSWKLEPEAQFYTLRIADTQDFSKSGKIIEKKVYDNYYFAKPKLDGITNGRWYWNVTQTDSEGNESIASSTRSFSAINGEVIFHQVFPPNEYQIADSKLNDEKFTWKKNLPDNTIFQISKSKDFSDIVFENEIISSVTSTRAKYLECGKYYWRLKTSSPDSDSTIETQVRAFTVVPPLDAPVIRTPQNNSTSTILPDENIKFIWNKTADAEYYKFVLYEEGNETPVYENSLVTDNYIEIETEKLSNGNYSWSIQAFQNETELRSRRTGFKSTAEFKLRKLRPVTLNKPEKNEKIDGLEAYENPTTAFWTLNEEAKTVELRIAQNETQLKNGKYTSISAKNGTSSVKFPQLTQGNYVWTVYALSSDGYNISSKEIRKFTVLPLPKLPEARINAPSNNFKYDNAYFKKGKTLTFQWQEVNKADSYLFTIFDDKNNKVCSINFNQKTLDDYKEVLPSIEKYESSNAKGQKNKDDNKKADKSKKKNKQLEELIDEVDEDTLFSDSVELSQKVIELDEKYKQLLSVPKITKSGKTWNFEVLDKQTKFDEGEFTFINGKYHWTVEPLRHLKDGKIFQYGTVNERIFEIAKTNPVDEMKNQLNNVDFDSIFNFEANSKDGFYGE